MKRRFFETLDGKKIPLPVFFPDATRAVLRTLDSVDIKNTETSGVLVNTYHLYKELGKRVIKKHNGIKGFMNFDGGVISDSGGFQVMSLAKSKPGGKITDRGVVFGDSRKKILFTPEESIKFQMILGADMVVVLDDFTPNGVSREVARDTVERTIAWARRSKDEFERICKKMKLKKRPYILGVVQGGEYLDLRRECAERLREIEFDGFGYGGWPIDADGDFNYEVASVIAEVAPKDYFLYGLGIGKPDEVVGCVKLGYDIFDCVLPTRDGRHKRLYVYEADSIERIDVSQPKFWRYYVPHKEKYYGDISPVSEACDCLLCKNYTRAYFAHLWRTGDTVAMRLATIHNLRFYSLLMQKLGEKYKI